MKVSSDPNPLDPFKDCPGVVFFGTPSLTLSRDEVLGFLAYYLKTPFGPRLLTMGGSEIRTSNAGMCLVPLCSLGSS